MPVDLIAPREVVRLASSAPVRLVDVRTSGEFAAARVPGARSLPLDELTEERLRTPHPSGDHTVYLLCASGARARLAAATVDAFPGWRAVVVDGGLSAWRSAGLPVIAGRGVISLERQVRIAAGALILSGALIGWGIHPAGFALAGAIGAGLVVAGVTDTCGLALLLARAPWNRKPAATVACC